MLYCYRITRRDFYQRGGFSNPKLFRRMRGGSWQHFSRAD